MNKNKNKYRKIREAFSGTLIEFVGVHQYRTVGVLLLRSLKFGVQLLKLSCTYVITLELSDLPTLVSVLLLKSQIFGILLLKFPEFGVLYFKT